MLAEAPGGVIAPNLFRDRRGSAFYDTDLDGGPDFTDNPDIRRLRPRSIGPRLDPGTTRGSAEDGREDVRARDCDPEAAIHPQTGEL